MTHLIFNIYLITILLGLILLMLKVHDMKLLLKTYFEVAVALNQCVKEIEERMRDEDRTLIRRCDVIEEDIQKILDIINRKEL